MLTILRGVVTLLFFGAPLVHLVFLIRDGRRGELAGFGRRVLHMLASFTWAAGMVGTFFLPEGLLSWIAFGMSFLGLGVDLRLTMLEARTRRQVSDPETV